MNTKLLKNEQGQALIFVIATMTVALAVGVGVSLRNLSSISRTSRTDTSARAQAAAEGGAENILARSDEDIAALVGQGPEIITFAPTNNDNITAEASVTVNYYNIPSGESYLPLEIKKDQVSEVKLNGGSVTVCWSSQVEGVNSDIYYTAYNSDGDIVRRAITSSSRTGFPSDYSWGGTADSSDGGNSDFDDCFSASSGSDLPSNVAGLRIRALNADTRLGIYPTSGSLPNQGYEIISVGKLQNVAEGADAEAVVTVLRSFSYAPGIFDFGVFSGSSGDALD